MEVKLEPMMDDDTPSVTASKVRYIKIDRGDKGEMILSERNGVMSIYQNGTVIYTEEARTRKGVTTRGE